MDQNQMIEEILSFVEKHQESYATRNIYRRLLGNYPEKITANELENLNRELQTANPEEVEAYFYMVM